MRQSEFVQEAHIIPCKVKTEVTLVAYVDASAAIEELKQHLTATLPSYMIPSHIIPLETFPLNKNGKLDRSKLPSPSTQSQDNTEQDHVDSIDSENPIVEVVLLVFANELRSFPSEIWKERGRSFFELGGTR